MCRITVTVFPNCRACPMHTHVCAQHIANTWKQSGNPKCPETTFERVYGSTRCVCSVTKDRCSTKLPGLKNDRGETWSFELVGRSLKPNKKSERPYHDIFGEYGQRDEHGVIDFELEAGEAIEMMEDMNIDDPVDVSELKEDNAIKEPSRSSKRQRKVSFAAEPASEVPQFKTPPRDFRQTEWNAAYGGLSGDDTDEDVEGMKIQRAEWSDPNGPSIKDSKMMQYSDVMKKRQTF